VIDTTQDGRAMRVDGGARDNEIERVRTFARVFDHYGVDAILGLLLPGVGDAAGSLLGLYIVGIAIRRRMPGVFIVRMLINLGADMLLGVVPLLGDVADFLFKANDKNLRLLESRAPGGKPRPADWAVLIAVALGFVAVVALVIYLVAAVIHRLSGSAP
jgi:hypothetical protein